MPSTFDPLLRLELQATGENATTWGVKTNNNLDLIAVAIAGVTNLTVLSGDTSLTTANAATDQARSAILVLQGTPAGDANLIVPASPKTYAVVRNTGGSFNITIKQPSGTGTVLPATGTEIVVCTSTTCIGLVNNLDSRVAAVSASVVALNAQVSALNVQVAAVSAQVSALNALDIRVIE